MAINITWATKVINVPRADMTLISVDPSIYNLDLNEFRLTLKSIEASEEGIPFIRTHNHNTQVTLGSLTFARVIEIINGYTVTFEDGQYAVNLINANSNVGAVVNVNQVSVRSANSAGLITSQYTEYIAFNNGVTIDSSSGNTGILFPLGTGLKPVNNIADAKAIADINNFKKIYVRNSFTFSDTDNLDGYTIVGENTLKTLLTFPSGMSTTNMEVRTAVVQGEFSTKSVLSDCYILDVSLNASRIEDSILFGTVELIGSNQTDIINCYDGLSQIGTNPIVNLGNSGPILNIKNYNGSIQLTNYNDTNVHTIDMNSGEIKLDSSILTGTFILRGIGILTNDASTGITLLNKLESDITSNKSVNKIVPFIYAK